MNRLVCQTMANMPGTLGSTYLVSGNRELSYLSLSVANLFLSSGYSRLLSSGGRFKVRRASSNLKLTVLSTEVRKYKVASIFWNHSNEEHTYLSCWSFNSSFSLSSLSLSNRCLSLSNLISSALSLSIASRSRRSFSRSLDKIFHKRQYKHRGQRTLSDEHRCSH